MNSQPNLPLSTSEKLTKEDITEHNRTPAEHAFYESFLLQSRSDIENLYASNIYWSQKHAKEVKDLNRQKMVVLSSMTKEQKEMVKRMQKLQEKQEQLLEDKMKQYLAAKENRNGRRLRPQSTSAVPNTLRLHPEPPRPRSGSSSLLGANSDLSRSSHLSKSSQNLSQLTHLEVTKNNLKTMSKSCEDLSTLGTVDGRANKLHLPAIQPSSRTKSTENLSDDDSFFITKLDHSPPISKPQSPAGLLSPTGFNPERRRGSLPNPEELNRQLDIERQRSVEDEPPLSLLTQGKWVPKTLGRSLPPI